MKLEEIKEITRNADFTKNMENYLLEEITENGFEHPLPKSPFDPEDVTNKLIFNTILYCTLLLATLMYVLINRGGD